VSSSMIIKERERFVSCMIREVFLNFQRLTNVLNQLTAFAQDIFE
jgi:hypothetical protein